MAPERSSDPPSCCMPGWICLFSQIHSSTVRYSSGRRHCVTEPSSLHHHHHHHHHHLLLLRRIRLNCFCSGTRPCPDVVIIEPPQGNVKGANFKAYHPRPLSLTRSLDPDLSDSLDRTPSETVYCRIFCRMKSQSSGLNLFLLHTFSVHGIASISLR